MAALKNRLTSTGRQEKAERSKRQWSMKKSKEGKYRTCGRQRNFVVA